MTKPSRDDTSARLVYTTREMKTAPEEPLTPTRQTLTLMRRRVSGGKWVVEVQGFVGRQADLEALARRLKNACATGGTLKDGLILLQGDCIDRAMAFLKAEGHHVKRSGG
jgi:translation initiation factor 1